MRALWLDRQLALITCLKDLNVSRAFLKKVILGMRNSIRAELKVTHLR